MKILKYLFFGLCIGYFPAIIVYGMLLPTDFSVHWLNILLVFLITAPVYFLFIQCGILVLRKPFARGKRALSRIFIISETVMAVVAAVFCIVGYIENNLSAVAFWISLSLVFVWLAELALAVIRTIRRKKLPVPCDKFQPWLFVLCVFLAVAVCCATAVGIFYGGKHAGGTPDPDVPNDEESETRASEETFEIQLLGEPVTCKRGERQKITVRLTCNYDYEYVGSSRGFCPIVELVYVNDGSEYALNIEAPPLTNDLQIYTITAGSVNDVDFYFTVPDDAPAGEYVLRMRFEDTYRTYDGALTIIK